MTTVSLAVQAHQGITTKQQTYTIINNIHSPSQGQAQQLCK